MPSLTEADNDRTLDLRVGDTVEITLAENATTGYRWAIERIDSGIVEDGQATPNYPSGQVGSGGEVKFSFRRTSAGSGDVVLKYWRHFEGDASVTRRFRVRLESRS